MILDCAEFIRRFSQHILPQRFTKIRTYGYLSNRNRHRRINEVLTKMKLPLHKGLVKTPVELRMMEQYGIDLKECPCCKNKTMQLVGRIIPACPAGRHGSEWMMADTKCGGDFIEPRDNPTAG